MNNLSIKHINHFEFPDKLLIYALLFSATQLTILHAAAAVQPVESPAQKLLLTALYASKPLSLKLGQKALDAGSDPNGIDLNSRPFLSVACYNAREDSGDFARFLVENKADVNGKDRERGETALMSVVSENLAAFLIEHKADVNMQDNCGKTALDHRIAHEKIVKVLLGAGASVCLKDRGGKSLLQRVEEAQALPIISGRDRSYEVSTILCKYPGDRLDFSMNKSRIPKSTIEGIKEAGKKELEDLSFYY